MPPPPAARALGATSQRPRPMTPRLTGAAAGGYGSSSRSSCQARTSSSSRTFERTALVTDRAARVASASSGGRARAASRASRRVSRSMPADRRSLSSGLGPVGDGRHGAVDVRVAAEREGRSKRLARRPAGGHASACRVGVLEGDAVPNVGPDGVPHPEAERADVIELLGGDALGLPDHHRVGVGRDIGERRPPIEGSELRERR